MFLGSYAVKPEQDFVVHTLCCDEYLMRNETDLDQPFGSYDIQLQYLPLRQFLMG